METYDIETESRLRSRFIEFAGKSNHPTLYALATNMVKNGAGAEDTLMTAIAELLRENETLKMLTIKAMQESAFPPIVIER